MKQISIELDTCVNTSTPYDEYDGYIIDPEGDNEESYFLEMLARSGIKCEIMVAQGPSGQPLIKYTANTKEDLIPLLSRMSTTGQSEDEVRDIIKDWDGEDFDYLIENIIG